MPVVSEAFTPWTPRTSASRNRSRGSRTTRLNLQSSSSEIMPPSLTAKEDLLESMRAVAAAVEASRLSQRVFENTSGISANRVLQHFDSWSEACQAAGLQCGPSGAENLKRRPRIDEAICLSEMRRIAEMLGSRVLTKRQFDSHANVSSYTVIKRFDTWVKALIAAGLEKSENLRDELTLESLATVFSETTRKMGKIPTIWQLARRTGYCKNTFSRKFGGYFVFKQAAIEYLLSRPDAVDPLTRDLLTVEQRKLLESSPKHAEASPFKFGRTLGFRAFAYAPTYEQEVVALFGAVAGELGFEIISQRIAFPDCLTRRILPGRRKRFCECRIEFELRSRDFLAHGHPTDGCDLIVCWEHNWETAPLEVLELRAEISRLPGWK